VGLESEPIDPVSRVSARGVAPVRPRHAVNPFSTETPVYSVPRPGRRSSARSR
jgi:hypothetical protein